MKCHWQQNKTDSFGVSLSYDKQIIVMRILMWFPTYVGNYYNLQLLGFREVARTTSHLLIRFMKCLLYNKIYHQHYQVKQQFTIFLWLIENVQFFDSFLYQWINFRIGESSFLYLSNLTKIQNKQLRSTSCMVWIKSTPFIF